MATTPTFASTPRVLAGLVPGTADNSSTAPTNVTDLGAGAAAGTKIEEIIYQGVGTTAAGILRMFLYDGSTLHLIDEIVVTAVTPSTTAAAFRKVKQYDNLIIPNATWHLKCAISIAGDVSLVKVVATGADLT